MHQRITVLALLALAACSPKTETWQQAVDRMRVESDSAKSIIEAANARFARYVAEGKADSAALNYAVDAVLMLPNEPPVTGREAIQAKLAEWIGYGTWQFTVTTEHVDRNGPMAVEMGRAVQSLTPGPHAPPGIAAMFPDTVKYVTYWRLRDGGWHIIADISNSNRALPAPAAARRH